MNKMFVVIALALLAGGCAGSVTRLAKDAREMSGHPIEDAIERYGYPTDKKQFGSDTVYVWKTDTGGAAIVPCTLRIVAGPDGIIKPGGDVVGSNNACRVYARRKSA